MTHPRAENLPSSTWHPTVLLRLPHRLQSGRDTRSVPRGQHPFSCHSAFPHAAGPLPVTLSTWKLLQGFAPGPPLELSPATCGPNQSSSLGHLFVHASACLLILTSSLGGNEPRSCSVLSPPLGLAQSRTLTKVRKGDISRLPGSAACFPSPASLELGFSPFTQGSFHRGFLTIKCQFSSEFLKELEFG